MSSESGTGELLSVSGAEQLHDTLLSGRFAHLVSSEPLVSTDPIPSFQLNPIHGTPPADEPGIMVGPNTLPFLHF